jgi:bifunctional non-homologous end joining protein LigD
MFPRRKLDAGGRDASNAHPATLTAAASRREPGPVELLAPAPYRGMPWHNPPRARRTPPAGFIQPCRPTLVANPPAGPGWLHEVKHDGFRTLARKQGERVEVWSRFGTDFTARFSNIDFGALRTKAGGARASFVAFDLLSLEGDDLRQRPLEERRDALSRLVAGIGNIQFSASVAGEGAIVFAHACQLGLEGIVSKRAGSRYTSGASRNWMKCLSPEFQRR